MDLREQLQVSLGTSYTLERGVAAHSGWAPIAPFMFPELGYTLGGDARYQRLCARMGLP